MFQIDYSRPSKGDPFFNTKASGGYSQCIKGKPTISGLDVLCNCVGAACAFFNRQYSLITGYKGMKYPYFNCNAELFIKRNNQYYGLQVVQQPVEGGIMVWEGLGDLAGHVAFVGICKDANTTYTAESGYNSFELAYYNRTNSNGNWGLNTKNYKYLGCIVNPAVGIQRTYESVTPTPTPTPSTTTRYTVVKGDCLSKIGAKFGVDWKEIASLNNIPGPKYTIYVGQVLTIPGGNTPSPAPQPTPTPTPQPSETLIPVNTIVTLKQGAPLYNSSSDENPNGYAKAKTTTITRNNGSKHPYNTTGDYGWMDASGFTVNSNSPSDIVPGKKVRVMKGARTYTGVRLASFVYNKVYDVIEKKGDRVVIGIGKAVTAAVNVKDLYLA